MKVFISHSWKNKTKVQQIADELKAAGVEIWLDAHDLLPGHEIQNTIDAVLAEVHLVVLVWSKEASQSNGVAAEIYTSSRLKKLIIPCFLDDTLITTHPYLQQIKGIHFNDFKDGIGRLKMALLNYMARDFGMQNLDSIKAMNEFMGSMETANHLVYKEDIVNKGSEEDKEFWLNKIQQVEEVSAKKLKEEEQINREMMAFLTEKMKVLETDLNDKNKIQELLTEMRAYKYATYPAFRTFIDSVQKIYDEFGKDAEQGVKAYKKEMEQKLVTSKDQLKSNFGVLADFLFAAAFENMQYFFLSSADHLQKLLQLSHQPNVHPVVADCANELLTYIKTPGGVIDNNQYGILGYTDDAYFVHSLLSALQQEGAIDTSNWNIDWVKINAGSEVVFNMVGNHIRQMLDQSIAAYCQQLVQKHVPSTNQQPASEQDQVDALQKAKDDVWKAKLMSLETAMIQNPVY